MESGASKLPFLLVSVKNAAEAALALELGVDWIDLKSPEAGPLGAPSLETVTEVVAALGDWPRTSIALGELPACDAALASELCESFGTAKIGLAGEADNADWEKQLFDLADRISPTTRLTPVIYADYQECSAPTPERILDAARQMDSCHILIDTFTKDGRTLLDWLSPETLEGIIAAARGLDCTAVLAGSIHQAQLSTLIPLSCGAIAVRGAVCKTDRNDEICPDKLGEWVELFRPIAAKC